MIYQIHPSPFGGCELTFIAGLLPARTSRPIDPNAGLYHYPPRHIASSVTIELPPKGPTLLQEAIYHPARQADRFVRLLPEKTPATVVSDMSDSTAPPTVDVIDARSAEVIVEKVDRSTATPAETVDNVHSYDAAPPRTRTIDGVTNTHASPPDSFSVVLFDNPRLSTLPPAALDQFKVTIRRVADSALSYLLGEESLTDLKTSASNMTMAYQVMKGEKPRGKTPLASFGPPVSNRRHVEQLNKMIGLLRVCVDPMVTADQVVYQFGNFSYKAGEWRYVYRESYRGDALEVQMRTSGDSYTRAYVAFDAAQVDWAKKRCQQDVMENRQSVERNRSPFLHKTDKAQSRIDGLNDQLYETLTGGVLGKAMVSNA